MPRGPPPLSRANFVARSQSVLQKPNVRNSYGSTTNIKQNAYNSSAYVTNDVNDTVMQSQSSRNIKANSMVDKRNRNSRVIITQSFPHIKEQKTEQKQKTEEMFGQIKLKYPKVVKKVVTKEFSIDKPVLCSGTGEMRYNETVGSNYPPPSGSQSFTRKRRINNLRA